MLTPLPTRLTIEEIKRLLRNQATKKGEEGLRGILAPVIHAMSKDPQVFDFGRIPNIDVDRKMAADLWHAKLLQLPFPTCIFTFSPHSSRITLLIIGDATVEVGGEKEVTGATAIVIISQTNEDHVRLDSFSWFTVPDPDHIETGSTVLMPCEGESDESFRQYTLACVAKVMYLSLLLNTKGLKKRHEPIPVKLNQKRARAGKPPLDAVTYVDLSGVHFGSGNTGSSSEKSMHFRRGHIRHFDDGSTTWVRDTIIKADGDLRKRARYQIR
jgi:hypothetical protein